jgi:hypothetical protein
MRSVDLHRNDDGTWSARIYSVVFTGSYAECVAWLRANGESLP